MREIKFRAWDEKDKVMEMLPRLHRKPDGTLWASNDSDSTVVPLMQFTGLFDRNGVEIYEGDIISHGFWNKREEEGLCLHSISWDEQSAQYVSTEINNEYGNVEYPFIDNLCGEVIGNIHQNPELLK